MTMSSIIHYHILNLQATGAAIVEVTSSAMTMTLPAGAPAGGPAGTQAPASPPTPAPYTIVVGADGSNPQHIADPDLDALALRLLGTLPTGPIAPGARWTAIVALNPNPPDTGTGQGSGLQLSPLRLPIANVFSRYVTVRGERATQIDGAGKIAYSNHISANGDNGLIGATGIVTSRVVFGLTTQRPLTVQAVVDVQPWVGTHHQPLGHGMRQHMVITMVDMSHA